MELAGHDTTYLGKKEPRCPDGERREMGKEGSPLAAGSKEGGPARVEALQREWQVKKKSREDGHSYVHSIFPSTNTNSI